MQVNSIQNQNFGLKLTGDNIFAISKSAGLDKVKADIIKTACEKLPFPKGTELWIMKPAACPLSSRMPAKRMRGAVIAITGEDICKGIVLDPITCSDKMLAYKYALALKKLSKADFSPKNNVKEQLTWLG